MCYDLTVSRIGIFLAFEDAASETLFSDDSSLLKKWSNQSDHLRELSHAAALKSFLDELSGTILDHPDYRTVWETLKKQFEPTVDFVERADIDKKFVRSLDNDSGQSKLAGVLPGRAAQISHGGISWNVSARASFTACVMEQQHRSAKLWWNFSATPEFEDAADVDEKNVASILELFEASAIPIHDLLKNAYKESIEKILTGPIVDNSSPIGWKNMVGKITVNFSDNDHASIKAYLLKLISEQLSQSEDRRNLAALGKGEFKQFVNGIIGGDLNMHDKSIELALDAPDAIGIMYREENPANGTIRLSGFARRPYALSPIDPTDTELKKLGTYVQSASRPLSAFIANQEANRFQ